jgi:hypothetical protein
MNAHSRSIPTAELACRLAMNGYQNLVHYYQPLEELQGR